MKIDAWCTMAHYADHLRPIWEALPAEARGQWYRANDDPPGDGVLVVGAYRDLQWVGHRYQRMVLVEHGIGQTYADNPHHPAYPGGDRDPYDLLIAPGAHVLDPAAKAVAAIGCPKLDPWLSRKRMPHPRHVVLSFHWDCEIAPEAGTAFWDYLPRLEGLAAQIGGLFIHAHPRIQDDVFEQVERIEGCAVAESFEWVLDTAAVYCCDNSSTLYEFAATDRPVIQLQSSRYRPDARHGKRFYDWNDIGPIAWHPSELPQLVEIVNWSSEYREARRRRIQTVYARLDGKSSAAAADAVLQLVR